MLSNAVRSSYKKTQNAGGGGQRSVHEPLVVTVEPDGSDSWRLEPVAQLIQRGGVSA